MEIKEGPRQYTVFDLRGKLPPPTPIPQNLDPDIGAVKMGRYTLPTSPRPTWENKLVYVQNRSMKNRNARRK